jgi:peptide/nickel transport system substrate-binding protein
MLMSLPRDEWVQTTQYGLSEIANYFAAADDPLVQIAGQKGIVKYPYDPSRAQQLFAQAGWTKGPDGLLHNGAGQTTGPFLCCRNAGESDAADVRESLLIVDALKQAGIQAEHPFPATPAGVSGTAARKFSSLAWQGRIAPGRFTEALWFKSWHSVEAPVDANNWTGGNLGSWINPGYDRLNDQMNRTIEAGPRQELRLDLIKMINEEMPAIPLWYEALGVTHKKNVTGLNKSPHAPPLLKMSTWNVHTWDLK